MRSAVLGVVISVIIRFTISVIIWVIIWVIAWSVCGAPAVGPLDGRDRPVLVLVLVARVGCLLLGGVQP